MDHSSVLGSPADHEQVTPRGRRKRVLSQKLRDAQESAALEAADGISPKKVKYDKIPAASKGGETASNGSAQEVPEAPKRVLKIKIRMPKEPPTEDQTKTEVTNNRALESDAKWLTWCELLGEYRKEKDHVSPLPSEVYRGKKLGSWVGLQKRSYHQRKKGKLKVGSLRMSDWRVAKLNELKFDWEVDPPTKHVTDYNEKWLSMWEILRAYKADHGHSSPSPNEKYREKEIGRWAVLQRLLFRKRRQGIIKPSSCRMNDWRISKLTELDFVWNPEPLPSKEKGGCSSSRVEASNKEWLSMWKVLEQYVEEKGHSNPTSTEMYHSRKIGRWVETQRSYRRKLQQGKLRGDSWCMSDWRIAKLDELQFVWKSPTPRHPSSDQIWLGWWELLKDYKEKTGHASPSSNEVYCKKGLGRWVRSQRIKVQEDGMSDWRIAKLNELDFVWNLEPKRDPRERLDEIWSSWCELLRAYKKENGHISPHTGEVYQGKQIGNWIITQRYHFRKGTLPSDRIDSLNEIGIVWEPEEGSRHKSKHDEKWLVWWELLRAYKEENGHSSPGRAEVYHERDIGAWVKRQRDQYHQRREGKLKSSSSKISNWRIAKLDELEFVWGIDDNWLSWCELLKDYKDEKGHSSPPSGEVYHGKPIGRWVYSQRRAFLHREQGKIPPSSATMSNWRISKLNEIGFLWEDPAKNQGVKISNDESDSSTIDEDDSVAWSMEEEDDDEEEDARSQY